MSEDPLILDTDQNSRRGRPRSDFNQGLPKGVYRRKGRPKGWLYDSAGRALGRDVESAAMEVNGRIDAGDSIETSKGRHRLLSRSKILGRSNPVHLTSGVYFLIKDEAIVYVGRSLNVYKRSGHHAINGRTYDRVAILLCEPGDCAAVEAAYIRAFDPPWNVAKPRKR